MVEHLPCTQGVKSSNLLSSTKERRKEGKERKEKKKKREVLKGVTRSIGSEF